MSAFRVKSTIQVSEVQLLVAVLAVWYCAVARPLNTPLAVCVVVLIGAVILERPWAVVVAIALLVSALSHHSDQNYQPLEFQNYSGVVQLVDDPEPTRFSNGKVRAVAKLKQDVPGLTNKRVVLTASSSELLLTLTAADSLEVEGVLAPISDTKWNRASHLVGKLEVSRILRVNKVSGLRGGVEVVRQTVVSGASYLPEDQQPLFLGLVVGDDRFQTNSQRDNFRLAGLSHLLAVSGQNVALVFVVLAPIFRYLPLRFRFVLSCLVLFAFALITRMEPSVLRAVFTAGVASWAAVTGSKSSGVRMLMLAIIALLVIDPFLAVSVGFQLSVAASFGILLLSKPFADALTFRGFNASLASALSVIIAAQIAVGPILIFTFGSMPVASVPANLLAGAVASLAMTVGYVVGFLGLILPDYLVEIVAYPIGLSLRWVSLMADTFANPLFPTMGPKSFIITIAGATALKLSFRVLSVKNCVQSC